MNGGLKKLVAVGSAIGALLPAYYAGRAAYDHFAKAADIKALRRDMDTQHIDFYKRFSAIERLRVEDELSRTRRQIERYEEQAQRGPLTPLERWRLRELRETERHLQAKLEGIRP